MLDCNTCDNLNAQILRGIANIGSNLVTNFYLDSNRPVDYALFQKLNMYRGIMGDICQDNAICESTCFTDQTLVAKVKERINILTINQR